MHPVLKTVLQRLGLGLLTLFVVSVLIFSSLELLPGGFAEAILGQGATPETVAAFNREIGLDRPATVRYLEWIGGVLTGDFGYSYAGRGGSIKQSVTELTIRSYQLLRYSAARMPRMSDSGTATMAVMMARKKVL